MLYRKNRFNVKLLFVIYFFWVIYFPGSLVGAAEKEDIKFADSDPQVLVGGSAEMKVFGKDLELLSVEISPSEGATISNIKETTPDPEDARQSEEKVKVWSFKVSVDRGAQYGKRSIVLVSKKGRSESQEIRFCTHIPKISDLIILSASESVVKVRFSVYDDAGDITREDLPECSFFVLCLPSSFQGIFPFLTANNITAKDLKNTVIGVDVRASYQNHFNEGCNLSVSITDKEGNRSNKLKTKIKFK